MSDSTSAGGPIRTLLWVAVIAVCSAVILKFSYEITKDQIAANRRARLLENLYSVLDPALIHDDLNPVPITATDRALLGSDEAIEVFVVIEQETPVAAIFATVAPNGYNAEIYLLVGIAADTGEITGVRAISHRETPGLGDLIETGKSDWIFQFDGKSLDNPPLSDWAVEKDEGTFDSITGATVTPRAVVQAVRNTLLYFDAHRDELFAEGARVARETPAVE